MIRFLSADLVVADVRRLARLRKEVRASLRRLLRFEEAIAPDVGSLRPHPSAGQKIVLMLPREHPPPGHSAKLH